MSKKSVKAGVYAGTFDPVTFGHLDILKRSLRIFDKVTVAVTTNPKKDPLFSIAERLEMLEDAVRQIPNVSVQAFDGLLVDYLRQKEAHAIIRGLRVVSDFEHEFLMALMNRKLDGQAETVFLMPSEEYSYLSSSTIKEVARYGGVVKELVPALVAARLRMKFKRD
jgi:pantetheine-phosphate adenylyltransferase